ncbi:MAG TPA: glycosyltransferase [Acetobacteraceae bacterium]|nr:glycosyltransferase [Acetobacteraceae bacterium]
MPFRVAVLIPCYNEAVTIGKVVADFRAALPEAAIYVFDNNSRDGTAEAALRAGALVRRETLQGKGHVVRRMFADIEADAYVLVDGDGTYEAAASPLMLRLLVDERLDMVTGMRTGEAADSFRRGHRLGNRVLTGIVRLLFGRRTSDMLSGYRAFSRRFVKSFPALVGGFETETEFTVHALALQMPVGEVKTVYRGRPAGSQSKLSTWSDGARILRTILLLVKEEKPFLLFSAIAALLFLAGLAFGIPVVIEFWATGLVRRLPTAVLASGLMVLAFLSFASGVILDSVARGRREFKRLAYLAHPAVTVDGLAGLPPQTCRRSSFGSGNAPPPE